MYSDEPYAIILIHDQAVHAARRKNWNKVFSPKALKGYGSISTAVRDLMDQITEMSTLLSSTAEGMHCYSSFISNKIPNLRGRFDFIPAAAFGRENQTATAPGSAPA